MPTAASAVEPRYAPLAMRAILGIDAAWTEHEPSGVALLVGDGDRWSCVAVAPSYESFIALAHGTPVTWSARATVPRKPPIDELVAAATRLAGCDVQLVAVDMPMSHVRITGRRTADNKVSEAFGTRHCSAHSPDKDRPGAIGSLLTRTLGELGFRLATTSMPRPASRTLLEVYPHTALLSLLDAERRVPYKVSKSSKLWPDLSIAGRIEELLKVFRRILARLECELGPLPFAIPPTAASLSELKKFEDALDAVVSAWMGMLYLRDQATPLGDARAAVWVPTDTIRTPADSCALCLAARSRAPIASNRCAVAFNDAFPVSAGHTLVVSRRHVGSLFDLADTERRAVWDLVSVAKRAIEQSHAPTAYNIGVNIGRDAGQTVDHVHLHVIPRYPGDVDDPRGGVRWVVPAKADYWSRRR